MLRAFIVGKCCLTFTGGEPSIASKLKQFNRSPLLVFTGARISNKMPSQENPPVLKFAKLSDKATTPSRGTDHAAGFDLYSALECVVPAKGKLVVPTDIQVAVPDGCYGRVAPRSGLAVKKFIDVGAGVIDHDYRGNVGVVLFNFSDEDFHVEKGMRIAQLICEKICYPELQELPSLPKTERGEKGYGSTGLN